MENSNLKKQVCNIEQSKKLKELGFYQNSLFYFVNNWRGPRKNEIYDGEHIITCNEKLITRKKGRERGTEVEFCSSYTQTELLAFLPYGIGFQDNNITQIADYLIELIVVEEFLVEEYNERYREFFEIDLTPHEL